MFDSIKEARRYQQLILLLSAGRITHLELQKEYELVPAQYEKSDEVYSRGVHKGEKKTGKCIEKSVVYIADFTYEENGKLIVEDVKGVRTKEYIIKRKLMLQKYGIRITEI